jgi:hypothetical protein
VRVLPPIFWRRMIMLFSEKRQHSVQAAIASAWTSKRRLWTFVESDHQGTFVVR